MSSFWLNRATLEGMYLLELIKRFVYYRNPYRQEIRREQLAFYETVWRDAAKEIGAACQPLGCHISEIRLDGARTRVHEYITEIDSTVTLGLLHEKPLVHTILRRLGLPVPDHAAFSLKEMAPAIEFLRAGFAQCVVKPAHGGMGRGVTTGICRLRHLARAAAVASAYCDELLIEEQIAGDNYRLLYLDGELLDAFIRKPPTVVGDGRTTIGGLVHNANEERLQNRAGLSQVLLPIDYDMRRTLAVQGLGLGSVPAKGRRVTLKTVINDNSGLDNSTATHLLDQSIIEAGRRAVEALHVRFAGIDIITTDPTVSLNESGGVILEVNGTPGLYFHYHKCDGAFPAALHVLRRLLVDDVQTRYHPVMDSQPEWQGTLV